MNFLQFKFGNPVATATEVFIVQSENEYSSLGLSSLSSELKSDSDDKIKFNSYYLDERKIWVYQFSRNAKNSNIEVLEQLRKVGFQVYKDICKSKIVSIHLVFGDFAKEENEAIIEGMYLSSYQFLKYFKDANDRLNSLKTIYLGKGNVVKKDLDQLTFIWNGVFVARDLVNEPLSYLTAEQLSKEIKKQAEKSGFKVEVWDKKKIEKEGMRGLLAVNKGSILPPTFNILEWKPSKPKNKKPIVLVGKGIVFDTGGLSLKPTPNSMDLMKSDMAGSAAVVGALTALAQCNSNIHVIGLIPATDNRPGEDAYVPGDVVKMHNGMTVEVLNTDAEGRMILADALSYASKYNPEIVIDLATLTGAAVAAIGPEGIVMMSNSAREKVEKLKESGDAVYERLVEFPMWDEYGVYIKSDIADLKNIGGPTAGAITAGKFLEHFIAYDWVHLDIAGPSFIKAEDAYKGKMGTGVGVRLLVHFITNYVNKTVN